MAVTTNVLESALQLFAQSRAIVAGVVQVQLNLAMPCSSQGCETIQEAGIILVPRIEEGVAWRQPVCIAKTVHEPGVAFLPKTHPGFAYVPASTGPQRFIVVAEGEQQVT